MTAVADTSPLCYLVLINEIDLLPALFSEVLIPPAVAAELADARAPEPVRRWWSAPPGWLRTAAPSSGLAPPELDRLHRGEREAILLALGAGPHVLLLDDKAARRAAKALGLPLMGLVGVLAVAERRGLVDVVAAVARLRRTNFRVSPALLKDLLEHDRRR